jgi:hypothetical protein
LIGHISGNFAGHVLAGQCKIKFLKNLFILFKLYIYYIYLFIL